MKTIFSAVVALPFLISAGAALADEPLQLTDSQLDHVTAGEHTAFAQAAAVGAGGPLELVITQTSSLAEVMDTGVDAIFFNTVEDLVSSTSIATSFTSVN
jgi:hypothetical protein